MHVAPDVDGYSMDASFDLSNPLDAAALLVALQRMRNVLTTESPRDESILRWRADLHSRVETTRVNADDVGGWDNKRDVIERWVDEVRKVSVER